MKCCGWDNFRTSVATMAIFFRPERRELILGCPNATLGKPITTPAAVDWATALTKPRRVQPEAESSLLRCAAFTTNLDSLAIPALFNAKTARGERKDGSSGSFRSFRRVGFDIIGCNF